MLIQHCFTKLQFLSGDFRPVWRFAWIFLALCISSQAFARYSAITPIIGLVNLKQRLHDHEADLLLVDVRNRADYLHDHLPGAINIPAELTFNQKGDRTRIASLQQIREVLSKAGIRNQDYVVLYDNGMLKNAAHVFWALETYGQEKISVLNSGIAGWIADHDPLTQKVTTRARSNYVPSISTHRLSSELATLLGIRNPHVAIIDARTHKEYLGLASQAMRKGHIPHAINIPWSDNLTHTGSTPRLKSRKSLLSLYDKLRPDEQVIAYCNRGKESAITYLVLRNLGYKVSIYDGAWLEWGNDGHLPVASRAAAGPGMKYGH